MKQGDPCAEYCIFCQEVRQTWFDEHMECTLVRCSGCRRVIDIIWKDEDGWYEPILAETIP